MHLKRLARALDVPTTAAGDKNQQMIEGKLSEDGRGPQNIQDILSGGMTAAAFVLQDEEGEIVTVEEGVQEPPEAIAPEFPREGEEMEALQIKLEVVRFESIELWQQLDKEGLIQRVVEN